MYFQVLFYQTLESCYNGAYIYAAHSATAGCLVRLLSCIQLNECRQIDALVIFI